MLLDANALRPKTITFVASLDPRMKKILTLLFTVFITAHHLQAQSTIPRYGLSDERDIYYVFTHADIWQDPKTLLKNATLVIKNDKIISIGINLVIPKGAVVYDLKGKMIYPSFIDAFSTYGLPEIRKERPGNRSPQYDTRTNGAYSWNQALKPEFDASRNFNADAKKAVELRKLGFGLTLSLQDDGIARGTAVVVALGEGKENELLVKDKAAAIYSFNKGTSTQDYPASLMGSIALLRQTYCDAKWYQQSKNKNIDISLESWISNQELTQIFDVNDVWSGLRADKIAKEFNVNYVIKGSGDEYKRIDEIKKTGDAYIIPVNYPKTLDVSNPYDAIDISLAELKQWEEAPSNGSVLEKAGIKFAFTTYGLKDKKDFLKNIQKAILYGLSKEAALSALTQTPASILKISDRVGSLKPGMLACFFISNKDVFDKENIILEQWILGKRYADKEYDLTDVRGRYKLSLDTLKGWDINISGEALTPEWQLMHDSTKVKVNFDRDGQQFTLRFEVKKGAGNYRLNGVLDANDKLTIAGDGQTPDGRWIQWKAIYATVFTETKKDSLKKDTIPVIGKVWYPDMAYGNTELPQVKSVLIKNSTVWTNEKEGILTNTDVLISKGKIQQIGKNIDANTSKIAGLEIIDGTGMHLTAGIIDEHSHIAIAGDVNEGTAAITSEVRIGDVIDPEDVNIYRQLAGGVTTSHLLHGSANPIGGQTALIKLRWGKSAEAMKFEGADPFIKFALGENVKQSNWGDNFSVRYPQTRMGVEQTYIDAFTRAREYDQSIQKSLAAKDKSTTETPRRNLQMEALAEILNKKRFITCHSYQQGEINMLMHVADTFGFKVNTFTHILEGYKVADKMKAHGAGGSTFSDWWGYKYEVMEAIPYNGAIMNRMGIITAFNSDDAEMARRLNQEAAKAVKYGGVSEEEALKFVTLNPAKLLHIDKRVGSIAVGKDADIVIWNDNPLSVYAHPIKTFVDGICYYDFTNDQQKRLQNESERQRIIKAMISAKEYGAPVDKPSMKIHELQHCNNREESPY